jgi:RHS repeat-associated protein
LGLFYYRIIQHHKRLTGDTELVVKEAFTYSPQDRLLTHTHQINGGTVQLLADNTYDELGQLTSKKVGNTSSMPLQKVDYAYNIRGWLTGINNDPTNNLVLNTTEKDLFGFKINYNTIAGTVADVKPLYNGNIAETYWRTDAPLRKYGYVYDNLNRLKSAVYQKPGNAIPVSGAYNESLSYDKNGNIMSLQRFGTSDAPSVVFQIDDLSYEYSTANGNQLTKVTDGPKGNNGEGFIDGNKTGDDYTYDGNGNLITDKNKNITAIVYNHLNLPTKITFGMTGTIEYIYNVAGQKLEKIVTQGTTITSTNYLGGYQYLKPHLGSWALQFFPTAEGYVKNTVVNSVNNYSYVFNYTDHLGNVRLSYSDADKNGTIATTEIVDESNYYPFGLKHSGYNGYVPTDYKYKYNGKELQDELGLNMYDYGARNYDPALGRWMNIDPHSENYYSVSPYVSFVNNPIFFVDPTGEDIYFWQVNSKTGEQEQVSFNKLDKNVQKGILAFGKTKAGYSFLASFANAGDKIGSLSFEKDGKYSDHNFNVVETNSEFADEGTSSLNVDKGGINVYMEINKNLANPNINYAETIGHEAFLHIQQDIGELIKTFETKGFGKAFDLEQKQRDNNKHGYKDHLAVKDDKNGRAKKYFEYITQLKTVLNPNEVQKHVNKEMEKTYKAGKDGSIP